MKYRIKHIRCKNLMLLEAANLNMPSSFIIKTKRPMSKHSLKRMAAKIIRESYGQRMSGCIVEELEVDGPRSPSQEMLLKRFKYKFKKLGRIIANNTFEIEELLQCAKKLKAKQPYDALNSYIDSLYSAYNNAANIIEDNYGPLYESYSQPKYQRLVEELETDGPRGGVSPSHRVKDKIGGHFDQTINDYFQFSELYRERLLKNSDLRDAVIGLHYFSKKLRNKNITEALDKLRTIIIITLPETFKVFDNWFNVYHNILVKN
jgi:hypothetical protein